MCRNNHSIARRLQSGVTLMEVLIVIMIVGVLAGLALPNFSTFVLSQRVKSMASELHVTLVKARSEAIKRNRDVTVSPTDASAWQKGWKIVDPENAANTLDVNPGFVNITATGPASVIYRSSGRLNTAAAPSFDIGANGTPTKRCVTIDLSGRPLVKPAAC